MVLKTVCSGPLLLNLFYNLTWLLIAGWGLCYTVTSRALLPATSDSRDSLHHADPVVYHKLAVVQGAVLPQSVPPPQYRHHLGLAQHPHLRVSDLPCSNHILTILLWPHLSLSALHVPTVTCETPISEIPLSDPGLSLPLSLSHCSPLSHLAFPVLPISHTTFQ